MKIKVKRILGWVLIIVFLAGLFIFADSQGVFIKVLTAFVSALIFFGLTFLVIWLFTSK